MRSSVRLLVLVGFLAGASPAFSQDGSDAGLTYERALECAAVYEVWSNEAETFGEDEAHQGRWDASEKAGLRAGGIGVMAGKSTETIMSDLKGRVEAELDKPYSSVQVRFRAKQCDTALGLNTP